VVERRYFARKLHGHALDLQLSGDHLYGSAAGQPTRPTQPFIFSESIKWVVKLFIRCVLLAQVAPSGECLRGNGGGYLIGLLAA